MRAPKFALIVSLAAALVAAPAAAIAVSAPGAGPGASLSLPQLVKVRAAAHTGYDRVVFEFRGGLPENRDVEYVPELISDGEGAPVRIAGAAILQVTMSFANAHSETTGAPSAPARLIAGLPNVIEVVQSGDFEGYVTYGIGLARGQAFDVFTLSSPSRVVVDIRKDYNQVVRRVTFLDQPRYIAGTPPYTQTVPRVVPATTPAGAVLHQLFAGPRKAEREAGLRTVRSTATDFERLSITSGIARVRLLGGCSSGGSTFTVADLIMPTLKQFSTVDYVKIYDPSGNTAQPTGNSDSIPECLEP